MANEAQRRKEFLERERKKEEAKKNPIKKALNSIFRISRDRIWIILFHLIYTLFSVINKRLF